MRTSHRIAIAALAATTLVGGGAALATTSTSAPAAEPARLDATLDDVLAAAAPDRPVGVIVHGTSFGAVEDAVAASGLSLALEFPLISAGATVGTPDQIRALADRDGVTYLEADAPLELLGDTSHHATRGIELIDGYTVTVEDPSDTTDTGTTDPNGKGRENGKPKGKAVGLGGAGSEEPTTTDVPVQADGEGVSIAIIDSGVDGTHPMFAELDESGASTGASRVVVNKKFVPLCPVTLNSEAIPGSEALPCFGPASDGFFDPENSASVDVPGNDSDTISAGGHGTHVAAIAAGGPMTLEDGRTITGAAPKAKVVSLSSGAALSVAAALQAQYWVLENHTDPCGDGSCPAIRVVNNSYGPQGGGEFDPESATVKIQGLLADQGVVMVWAAGNDGGGGTDNRSNPPGQDPKPGVLMVANYDDDDSGTRDGSLASSSSRGDATRQRTWPDLSAPGTDITSACRPTLAICSSGEGDAGTISGTSMAAPHVAGIVAQLFELVPQATPAKVEDTLEDTAHQFSFGGAYYPDFRNADHTTSFDKGHGLVDAVAAANDLLGLVIADPVVNDPACAAGDALISDASGDGYVSDAFLINADPGITPPQEPASDPTVDILTVGAAQTAEGLDLVFRMSDVTGAPPEGKDGMRIHLQATMGQGTPQEFTYFFAGTLSSDPTGAEPTVDFGIDVLDGNLYSEIVDLPGAFDPVTDTITIEVTNAALDAYNKDAAARGARPEIPLFAPGVRMTGLAGLTQTATSAVVVSSLADSDAAAGQCAFEYGAGSVDGAGPTETPEENDSGVDQDGNPQSTDDGGTSGDGLEPTIQPETAGEATLDPAGETSVTFDGVAPTTTVEKECTGPGDPECVTYLLRITEAGPLTLGIEARTPIEDFDLLVYDGDGTELDVFGNPGTPPGGLEGGTLDVERGAYFVVVQPYVADGVDGPTGGSTFTLSAALG